MYCGHIDCLLPLLSLLSYRYSFSSSYVVFLLILCLIYLCRSYVGSQSLGFYDSISQVICRRIFTGLFPISLFENSINMYVLMKTSHSFPSNFLYTSLLLFISVVMQYSANISYILQDWNFCWLTHP